MNKDNSGETALCNTVRELIGRGEFSESKKIIIQSMAKFPHAPEPHNLMGIQLEHEGDHISAMKHFRAAVALDPSYLPARCNLSQYADMFRKGHKDAYFEEDCPQLQDTDLYKLEYDDKGIGHIVKRGRREV